MIPALIDHLWQSTLFALGMGLLTLTLRRNGAAVRHALWFAASVKFLIPFALVTMAAGAVAARLHLLVAAPLDLTAVGRVVAPVAAASAVIAPITPPAAFPGAFVHVAPPLDLSPILLAAWTFGFAVVLLVWAMRWSRIHAALRAATPARLPAPVPVLSTPAPMEPGVVGLWRPVLIVPEGIAEQLSPAQWQAVLAHELCHIRRRDNLTGAIHMLVQALFWLHPLVWWLGKLLIAEREQACDEAVVRDGADAHIYAEGILKVCRLYLQQPLACAAGASGADLKQRVRRILAGQTSVRLGAAKTAMLTAAASLAVAAPVSAGLIASTPIAAQAGAAFAPPEPAAAAPVQEPAPIPGAQIARAPSAPARHVHAKPTVLASIQTAEISAPAAPAIRPAEVVTDLSRATPDLPVIAADGPTPPPPMEEKMPRLVPAVLTAITMATSASAAPTVYIPPGADHPRFGGEFALSELGPVSGYWRTQCVNWRIRSQARRTGPFAPPPVDLAFKRFVSGLIAYKPNYEDMSPAMAEAVRKNLPTYWPSINRTGHASVARKFDTTENGEALYVLDLAGGVTHWNLTVNADGKIASAFFCGGAGL